MYSFSFSALHTVPLMTGNKSLLYQTLGHKDATSVAGHKQRQYTWPQTTVQPLAWPQTTPGEIFG